MADTLPLEGESFGERLRRLRRARGISQEALAGSAISTAHVSRLESGGRRPSIHVIRFLAARLEVTPDYLESGSELSRSEELELELSRCELALGLDGEGAAELEERLRQLLAEAEALAERELARRARAALARRALAEGRGDEALGLLESSLASNGQEVDVETTVALAQAYALAGRGREAVSLLESALSGLDGDRDEERILLATHLGYALADQGEFERAAQVVAGVASAGDPHGRIRAEQASAERAAANGESRRALRRLRKAVGLLEATEQTLELARAHVLSARILLFADRIDEAGRQLGEAERWFALGADAADAAGLAATRARHSAAAGRADEALAQAEQALAGAASETAALEARYALGLAHAKLGRLDEARPWFEQALDQLIENGQWPEALHVARSWREALTEAGENELAERVRDRESILKARATTVRIRPGR